MKGVVSYWGSRWMCCYQQGKMEILNMKRAMQILSLVGLSSVYVTAGACTMSGDGWSFFPTIFWGLGHIPFVGSLV